MAFTTPLNELLIDATVAGRSARCVFTWRNFATYPTPLVARGSALTRPAAEVATEAPELLVVPRRWWDASIQVRYPFDADRVVFSGTHAFEALLRLQPSLGGSAFVRLPAAERVVVGLPLSLAALGTTPSAILGDEFVSRAISDGLLLTPDGAAPGEQHAIVHVGGEHAADVAKGRRCRLLCVHIAEGDAWQTAQELAKDSPAHAIVVVSGDAGAFFSALYRKILHDVPIDRAVAQARDVLQGASLALCFRPGGETDLLLSRLAATQAGLLDWPARSVPEESDLDAQGDVFAGELEDLSLLEQTIELEDALESADVRLEALEALPSTSSNLRSFRKLSPTASPFGDVVDETFSEEAVEAEPLPDIDEQSFADEAVEVEATAEDFIEEAQATPAPTRQASVRERFAALLPSQQELVQRLAAASANAFDQELHTLEEVTRLAREGADTQLAKDALTSGSFAKSRWTQAWFEGSGDDGSTPLEPDASVGLVVQIVGERRPGAVAAALPFARLAHLFRDAAYISLDIELYGAPDDWHFEERKLPLRLPAQGDSQEVRFAVTPKRAGRLPLRICVYHRNLLVQSLLLKVSSGSLVEGQPPLSMDLDYASSADFQFLGDRPSPALSIFQNDAEDTHWIGPRVDGESPLGTLHPLSFEALKGPLGAARDALFEVHKQCSARYGYQNPLSKPEHRQEQLVELARAGFKFHEALFKNNTLQDSPRPPALAARVPQGGLVSIARLRKSTPKIPWQMLYDRPLYVSDSELALCPHAVAEMAKGPLDACAATCPKPDSDEGETTVCPLGFWGLRYRLEEPLALIDLAAEAGKWRVPRQADNPSVDQTELRRGLGVHVAYNASLRTHKAHLEQLQLPTVRGKLEVHPPHASGRDMRRAIRGGAGTLFYFYCHGEYRGEDDFSLVLRAKPPDILTDADLASQGPSESAFLAFLNVCDSSHARSDASRRLLQALRNLGAIGIVSSETEVREAFGKEFAESLIRKLGGGTTLGQAFFELRWEFLSKAWDASAFIYSLNGLDALRLV